jgi:hypothetical protein
MHCQREQIINRFLISYLFYTVVVHDGRVHVCRIWFYVFLQFYVLHVYVLHIYVPVVRCKLQTLPCTKLGHLSSVIIRVYILCDIYLLVRLSLSFSPL